MKEKLSQKQKDLYIEVESWLLHKCPYPLWLIRELMNLPTGVLDEEK